MSKVVNFFGKIRKSYITFHYLCQEFDFDVKYKIKI